MWNPSKTVGSGGSVDNHRPKHVHPNRADSSGFVEAPARRSVPYEDRVCGECGERYINAGAHAERCYGPVSGERKERVDVS